ncbi:hypothetical protein H7H78_02395 [Mycobacterium shinjukuense]|nr:hypothetical protein [Mycobacterium shinjukuense]MCV6984337.1 hypothetical protein [Mycobacterium shinjukuense]
MFARVLGPFSVIVSVTAVARASTMRTLLSEFEASSVWAWVTGAFVLLAGLVVIALHQYWRGLAAIIVSLMGWLFALRGLLLLAFPNAVMSIADATIGLTALWVSLSIVFALVGVYLTYVGWRPAPDQSPPKADAATRDLPRAA